MKFGARGPRPGRGGGGERRRRGRWRALSSSSIPPFGQSRGRRATGCWSPAGRASWAPTSATTSSSAATTCVCPALPPPPPPPPPRPRPRSRRLAGPFPTGALTSEGRPGTRAGHLPGQLLHGQQDERGAPGGQAQLRDHPARRGGAHSAQGGPDLPPGVPGVPRALQVQPGEDHQDQRDGHHEHAGPGQAHAGALPADEHQRGVRGPPGAPPDGGLLGQREPDRRAQLLRRGEAGGGDLDLRLPPGAQPGSAGGQDIQHLRPPDGVGRRTGRQQLLGPGPARGEPDRVRRRVPDAVLPVRGRPGGRAGGSDGRRAHGALQQYVRREDAAAARRD